MIIKKITTLVLLCIAFGINSQNQKDIDAIKQTIQNYYDGYIDRDLQKLEKAFDLKHGAMKVPITESNKVVGYKDRYFKELIPKWGNRKKLAPEVLQNCALSIVNIDVVDSTIASAKIIMKVDTVSYVDILSLHKIQGNWKITNKIYAVRK